MTKFNNKEELKDFLVEAWFTDRKMDELNFTQTWESIVDNLIFDDGTGIYFGVKSSEINANGDTVVTFTDDSKITISKGPKGDAGLQGPKGEQGPKGDTGPKGDVGLQGPKGADGEQGPKGSDGEQGSIGPKGDTGPKGSDGEQGPKGGTGLQGPKGSDGEQGPKGDTGLQGPKGADGEQGPKGDTGLQGPKGDTGLQGPKGNTGDSAYLHVAYANSADGSTGFTNTYPNVNLLTRTKSQYYVSTGTASNNSTDNYILDNTIPNVINRPLTITYDYVISNSVGTWSGSIRPTYGLGGANQNVSSTNLTGKHIETVTLSNVGQSSYGIITTGLPTGTRVTINNLKVEFGSVATPWMPANSEVVASDYPKYIGTYTNSTKADSTNPKDYTWALFRGADGPKGDTGAQGPKGDSSSSNRLLMKSTINGSPFSGMYFANIPIIRNSNVARAITDAKQQAYKYAFGFNPGFITEPIYYNPVNKFADLRYSITSTNNTLTNKMLDMYRSILNDAHFKYSDFNFPDSVISLTNDVLLATLPLCLTMGGDPLDELKLDSGSKWVVGDPILGKVGGMLYGDDVNPIKLIFNDDSNFDTTNLTTNNEYFKLNENTNYRSKSTCYIVIDGGEPIQCRFELLVAPIIKKDGAVFKSNVFVTSELYSLEPISASKLAEYNEDSIVTIKL